MNKKKMDGDVSIKSALSPKVVGYCMEALENYITKSKDATYEGFKEYYIKTKGLDGLKKAVDMITAQGYTEKDAKKYVNQRVFIDTWRGKYWETQVKKEIALKGHRTRFSTKKEDYTYNVDLIAKTFAIQVKPITYYKGTNKSLLIDKKRHKEAHKIFEKKFGIPVVFAFYDKNTNKIIYKRR